jgi:hypothetical protein
MTQYIRLVFNEELRTDAISDPTHYVISGPAPTPVVTSCSFADADHKVVDALVSGVFVSGGSYTITVSGIYDVDNNIINPMHKTIDLNGVALLTCTFGWDTPIDHDPIPLTNNTYNLGSATKGLKNGFFTGTVIVGRNTQQGYATLVPVGESVASNNSIFLDADNADALTYKDGAGVLHDILNSMSWSTPVDAIITPDGNGTRDLATAGARFKDGHFSGDVAAGNISVNFAELATINPTTASNYSLFFDSTNANKLSYKDGAGATHEVGSGGGGGITWSTPVDAIITPDGNGTRDLGVAATGAFKDGYFTGEVAAENTSLNFSKLTPSNPAAVDNYSLFLDSTDSNKLKYKDGSGATTELTAFAVPGVYMSLATGLINGATNIDDITTTAGDPITEGFIGAMLLSSTLTSGDVLVEIYSDITRLTKLYSRMFDLAADTYDFIPSYFMSDDNPSAGIMHVDITNYTGSTGDFQLTVRTVSVVSTATAPVGSGSGVNAAVAGEGIDYNVVSGQLDVELTPGGNLVITGGGAGAGTLGCGPNVITTASTTVVKTTTDQNIVGIKRFTGSSFGLSYHATDAGAPGAGTWLKGDFFCDVNGQVWRCTLGGTPGTWQYWGAGLDNRIIAGVCTGTNIVYTGTITAGSHEHVAIDVSGNFGTIQKLVVWGSDPTFGVSDFDQAFRIICHPNENYLGREQIFDLSGQIRKTNLTAGMTATVDVEAFVTTVGQGTEGDLVRMRRLAATIGEEYGRIDVRNTTPPSFEFAATEPVQQTFDIADPMMFVNEFVYLPYYNNSSGFPNKLFLTFINDGAASAVYGYSYVLTYSGGGAA